MILTGNEILKEIEDGTIHISPFDSKKVNANSYNLSLAPILKVYDDGTLDLKRRNTVHELIIPESGLLLQPGQLYLGSTVEYTATHSHVPMLEGRSSLARLGVSVHIAAGFGDIGFKGNWTLEITVVKPIIIYPFIEICQIFYVMTCGQQGIRYDGKYQGQRTAVESKLYEEFEGR